MLALLLLPVALAFTASGGTYNVEKTQTDVVTGDASGGAYDTSSTASGDTSTSSASGGTYVATTSFFEIIIIWRRNIDFNEGSLSEFNLPGR